jgi:hypothetical protein
MEVIGVGVLRRTELSKRAIAKTSHLSLLALAVAAIVLIGAAAQAGSIKDLPAVSAKMACTLEAFKALNLSGVADDNGQVTFNIVKQYAKGDLIPLGYNQSSTNTYTAPADLCAVYGNIGPGTMTGDNFVMYLPTATWTQRYVQNGCGGECGSANLSDPTQSSKCAPVINGQLVTATTDMGHETFGPWNVNNPWAAIDFAYRGVHVTAQVAKAVIKNFYSQPAAYSYFDGCSDGGREALMEAQRYPKDFDGIAAGSPANNMDVQNTYHHANRLLTNQSTPGFIPLPARNTYLLLSGNLPYIHAKVVAACDGLDGVYDSIIDDPRNCEFDTNTLVCANNGNEAGCLTQAQADAVFRIHDGARTLDGVRLEAEIASEWGSELDWTLYMPAAQGGSAGPENFVNGWLLKTFINAPYKDPTTDPPTPRTVNDLVWTVPGFHDTVASSILYSATNPDLKPFAASGGKLIFWAGWSDQHISPQGAVWYWDKMNEVVGDHTVQNFARFYLFPGMGHCGGGLGPNTFDVLTPLMAWVESGAAPFALVANNSTTSVSRPVYPYPTVARWKGTGSTNDAVNFFPYKPHFKSDIKTNNAGNYLYEPGFPQAKCTAVGTQIVCVTTHKDPKDRNDRGCDDRGGDHK